MTAAKGDLSPVGSLETVSISGDSEVSGLSKTDGESKEFFEPLWEGSNTCNDSELATAQGVRGGISKKSKHHKKSQAGQTKLASFFDCIDVACFHGFSVDDICGKWFHGDSKSTQSLADEGGIFVVRGGVVRHVEEAKDIPIEIARQDAENECHSVWSEVARVVPLKNSLELLSSGHIPSSVEFEIGHNGDNETDGDIYGEQVEMSPQARTHALLVHEALDDVESEFMAAARKEDTQDTKQIIDEEDADSQRRGSGEPVGPSDVSREGDEVIDVKGMDGASQTGNSHAPMDDRTTPAEEADNQRGSEGKVTPSDVSASEEQLDAMSQEARTHALLVREALDDVKSKFMAAAKKEDAHDITQIPQEKSANNQRGSEGIVGPSDVSTERDEVLDVKGKDDTSQTVNSHAHMEDGTKPAEGANSQRGDELDVVPNHETPRTSNKSFSIKDEEKPKEAYAAEDVTEKNEGTQIQERKEYDTSDSTSESSQITLPTHSSPPQPHHSSERQDKGVVEQNESPPAKEELLTEISSERCDYETDATSDDSSSNTERDSLDSGTREMHGKAVKKNESLAGRLSKGQRQAVKCLSSLIHPRRRLASF